MQCQVRAYEQPLVFRKRAQSNAAHPINSFSHTKGSIQRQMAFRCFSCFRLAPHHGRTHLRGIRLFVGSMQRSCAILEPVGITSPDMLGVRWHTSRSITLELILLRL